MIQGEGGKNRKGSMTVEERTEYRKTRHRKQMRRDEKMRKFPCTSESLSTPLRLSPDGDKVLYFH